MYERPTEPQSIGGVLDSGFKLFRASFRQVVVLAMVAGFLGQLPSVMMTMMIASGGTPENSSLLSTVMISLLIVMLVSMVFFAAIVSRMHGAHAGREVSMGDAFGMGFSCMLPLLGCMLLYGIAIGVGSILLLIPGIILSLSLMFGPYVLIIERGGVLESLKRSHSLVWGYWWRTSGIILIAFFIMMVAYVLVGIVAAIAIVMEPDAIASPLYTLSEALVTALLGGLITPLFYAMTLSAYYDLRLRRQGEDLAERIDAAPQAA